MADTTTPGPSPWFSIHALTLTQQQLDDARAGVYHFGGTSACLTVPVDWDMDPDDDRSWRYSLHALGMLEPVLRLYEQTGDRQHFETALAFALDYVTRYERAKGTRSEFLWYDMAVAQRLCYLSFIVRDGEAMGLDVDGLRASCATHATWLMKPQNYADGHNHGLFSDAALAIAAQTLPSFPGAAEWRATADRRFVANLRKTVGRDHVHLEHSPMYHFAVLGLIERVREYVDLGGPAAAEFLAGMRAAAPWLVMPDYYLPLLGDSNFSQVGRSWREAAASTRGIVHFDKAGYQIVKDDDCYFILSSGYHSNAHKHTDELGFEYYDCGRRILVDSGNYGYYYGTPGREYCTSARAHNTLMLNGADFGRQCRTPFGSATEQCGQAAGWYLLQGSNPRLAPQNAQHRRTVFLLPGRCLVICDDVEPAAQGSLKQVSRHFHFDPDIAVNFDQATGRHIFADVLGSGDLRDFSDAGETTRRLLKGRTKPPLQGLVYRAPRTETPNATIILQYSPGGDGETFAARRLRFRTILSVGEAEFQIPDAGTHVDDVDAWIAATVPADLVAAARDGGLSLGDKRTKGVAAVSPRPRLSDAAIAGLAARFRGKDQLADGTHVHLVGPPDARGALKRDLEETRPNLVVRENAGGEAGEAAPLRLGAGEIVAVCGPNWLRDLAALPPDAAQRAVVLRAPAGDDATLRWAVEIRRPKALYIRSFNAADRWLCRLMARYAAPRHRTSDGLDAAARLLDVAPEAWSNHFRFAVLQDPVQRIHWAYRDLIAMAGGRRGSHLRAPLMKLLDVDGLSLSEFAAIMLALPEWARPTEVRPQSMYLHAGARSLARCYSLEADLAELMTDLRQQGVKLPETLQVPSFGGRAHGPTPVEVFDLVAPGPAEETPE